MRPLLRWTLLGCLVVALPLVSMALIRIGFGSLTNQEVYYTGLGMSVAGILVFILTTTDLVGRKKEKEAKKIIEELQRKNQPLHHEQKVDLTSGDRSTLNRYRIIVHAWVLTAGFLSVIFISNLSPIETLTGAVAAGTVMSMFILISLWLNGRMNRILAKAKKTVIRGIVTDKNVSYGGSNNRSKHWVHIGDQKIKVNSITYGKYRVGNAAEFHLFEYFGNLILHHEKLERAGLESSG